MSHVLITGDQVLTGTDACIADSQGGVRVVDGRIVAVGRDAISVMRVASSGLIVGKRRFIQG